MYRHGQELCRVYGAAGAVAGVAPSRALILLYIIYDFCRKQRFQHLRRRVRWGKRTNRANSSRSPTSLLARGCSTPNTVYLGLEFESMATHPTSVSEATYFVCIIVYPTKCKKMYQACFFFQGEATRTICSIRLAKLAKIICSKVTTLSKLQITPLKKIRRSNISVTERRPQVFRQRARAPI